MSHTCPAPGCEVVVSDTLLMCKPHWYRLPKRLRDAIWDTYRDPGPGSQAHKHNIGEAVRLLRDEAAPGTDEAAPGTDEARIQALTVWQPWASLIAIGAKRFEFRRYALAAVYRNTRIAIHAGAPKVDRSEVRRLLAAMAAGQSAALAFDREIAEPFLERVLHNPAVAPLRVITCTAKIGRPVRNEELAAQLGCELVLDSTRAGHGMWGWPLSDIRPVDPPVGATGAQGFWPVALPRRYVDG